MKEYVEKEFAEEVPYENVEDRTTHYLPHHAVFRDDKKTTRCRIVFDASMREDGVFLNDCVLPRTDLQPNLASLLINFKQNWSHRTYLKDIPSSQAQRIGPFTRTRGEICSLTTHSKFTECKQ